MVGNHTGEGEVGVSRGKGTEHIEVTGDQKGEWRSQARQARRGVRADLGRSGLLLT